MTAADHILVGCGVNALVCAAMLAGKGAKALVLERNDRIGGCIRTEEITAPGFVHDVMATTFEALIKERGGEICTSADVAYVARKDGRAVDVRLASGEDIAARKSVICSVTPTQLYERLLSDETPAQNVGNVGK
jgi:phytoene dehydrogenase-like protein